MFKKLSFENLKIRVYLKNYENGLIIDIAEPEIPGWSIFQTCQFVLFNFESWASFKGRLKGKSIPRFHTRRDKDMALK